MAIKTISQFPSGIPADNDYILFEQNGEGKSATIGDAVNTCALSYEEIMANNIDLTNKVASASVIKDYDSKRYLLKYYSDAEVNSLGGFENTVKDFVNNVLQNDYAYYGWVQINSRYVYIGQKYYSNYGTFLLIGLDAFYYITLRNGAFTFKSL